jgi:hypothetical protein
VALHDWMWMAMEGIPFFVHDIVTLDGLRTAELMTSSGSVPLVTPSASFVHKRNKPQPGHIVLNFPPTRELH